MKTDSPTDNIDYFDTQLTDEEVVEDMAQKEAQAAKDAAYDKARWAKARNFRFTGGCVMNDTINNPVNFIPDNAYSFKKRPGIWFITPLQAYWHIALNAFRRHKLKIYRNPGLEIADDNKREVYWRAYTHGRTWLKEDFNG